MPNRILRDGILRSRRVFYLSPQAEVFYRRLMSVADDFGRYYADPTLLLSDCFPLRPTWADEPSMSLWMAECEQAKLILIYEVSGTEYLEIQTFNQRVKDGQKSKFPDFPGNAGKIPENPASRARTPSPPTTASHTPSEEKETQSEKKEEQNVNSEFDEQWQLLRKIYADTGKPLIESDFTKAHYMWRLLDFEQRTEAIANLSARKTHHDPQFIPSPSKYLYDGEYKRSVMPRPARNGNGKRDIAADMLEERRNG